MRELNVDCKRDARSALTAGGIGTRFGSRGLLQMTIRPLLCGALLSVGVGAALGAADGAKRLGVDIPESPLTSPNAPSPSSNAVKGTHAGKSAQPAASQPRLANALTPDQIKTLPAAQVEAKLSQQHPSAYYLYASRIFNEGRKDDAVVWYYVGELRYRFLLEARPSLEREESTVFSSVHSMVGGMINQYAAGDLNRWIGQIDQALAWDEANPNGFTSKVAYPAAYRSSRDGGEKLKAAIKSDPEKIRAMRAKRGLETK